MSYAATLTLPNGHVKVREEEMMYLEGGGTLINTEAIYTLTPSQCIEARDMLAGSAQTNAEIASILAVAFGWQYAIVHAAITALYVSASYFFNRAATGNGCAIIEYTYATNGGTVNPPATGTYTKHEFKYL